MFSIGLVICLRQSWIGCLRSVNTLIMDHRTESFNGSWHKVATRICSFHFWWRNSMTTTVYCDMPSWNSFYWFEIKKFLLSTVMLLTTLCWWIYDGDSFKLFVAVLLCWWQCKESSASISKLVTNTYRLQHSSPTPVIINDIAVLTWCLLDGALSLLFERSILQSASSWVSKWILIWSTWNLIYFVEAPF